MTKKNYTFRAMFLRKTLPLALAILLSSQHSFAQNLPLEKTLLWKISGNGLQKPSYLFGTMHLQDERLFRFTDSLYAFIKNVDRFYMEVDPQEGVMYVINEMAKPDSSPLLSQVMERAAYRKKSAELEKEIGIPADQITKKQAFLHSLRKSNAIGNKDMETAMDLWLYNLAKKQGKIVGGIEDVKEQLHLFMELTGDEVLFTSDEKRMETMIRTYLDEDLDKLYSYVEAMSEEDRIAFLDNRNIKMSHAIDSITKLGSGFFAIGALHLPGEQGVINILKKAGYTVTPVISKKRIPAADYKYTAISLPWMEVMDKDSLFTVEMPERASEFNMYGDMLPMNGTIDMSTGIFYLSGRAPGYKGTARDSSVLQMAERMNMKSSTWKKSVVDGKTVYDFQTKKREDYTFRIRIVDNTNSYIILLAGGQNEKLLKHPDIDRYMKTVKVLKDLPVITENTDWYRYKDSLNAFALSFPGEPGEIPAITASLKNQDTKGWDIFSTTFVDNGNQLFYMLFVKKALKGYYIQDPGSVLEEISNTKENNPRYRDVKTDTGSYKNFPAIWLTGYDMENGLKMKSMQVVRDNRTIALVMIGTEQSLTEERTNKYFNSLSLLPYKQDKWSLQKVEAANFEAFAPDFFEPIDTSSDEPGITYGAFDRYEDNSYGVDVYPVNKYFWAENDSAFYDAEINLLLHDDDSVMAKKKISNGDLPGIEVDIMKTSSKWRYRIIRNGDEVFFIYVHGSPAYVDGGTAKFLQSFRVLKTKKDDGVFVNKTALLLKDLSSSNADVAEEAQFFLPSAPFTKNDLPLLHLAILDDQRFDAADYNNTYSNLINHIVTLADPSTLSFIRQNFATMNNNELGYEALTLLARIQTDNSYSLLKDLLLGTPQINGDASVLSYRLSDSVALTAKLFPDVLTLLNDSSKIELLIPVILEQIEKGLLDSTSLRPYVNSMLTYMEHELTNIEKDNDRNWTYYNWFSLLEKFPDNAANGIIERLQSVHSLTIKYLAFKTAIRKKLPVQKQVIDKLAGEDYYRWDVYDLLKEHSKLSLFPKSQATQRLLFQAQLANHTADEYDVPKIQFIGERYRTIDGKKKRFYIFKVLVEDMEPMLGIAGGLPMNETGIDIEPDFMELFEDFNTATIDSQLDSLFEDVPPPPPDDMGK
jgi:uncharacterized protein YbaP (TraB family)